MYGYEAHSFHQKQLFVNTEPTNISPISQRGEPSRCSPLCTRPPPVSIARSGDATALSDLYDRYAPKIYGYIYRRVGDAALAEDLTGELFVRMLRAIQNEHAWHDSFAAWLYRIAHNLVVDHYRRQPPAPPLTLDDAVLASDQNAPEAEVEELLVQERIRAALEHLTLEQQEVLALRFGEGLKAKETARIMKKRQVLSRHSNTGRWPRCDTC